MFTIFSGNCSEADKKEFKTLTDLNLVSLKNIKEKFGLKRIDKPDRIDMLGEVCFVIIVGID